MDAKKVTILAGCALVAVGVIVTPDATADVATWLLAKLGDGADAIVGFFRRTFA